MIAWCPARLAAIVDPEQTPARRVIQRAFFVMEIVERVERIRLEMVGIARVTAALDSQIGGKQAVLQALGSGRDGIPFVI